MNASPELRQQMWELCYDLLPPDERTALVARIKSDPQAARLYSEVRLQSDLVGYAAKVEDSSLRSFARRQRGASRRRTQQARRRPGQPAGSGQIGSQLAVGCRGPRAHRSDRLWLPAAARPAAGGPAFCRDRNRHADRFPRRAVAQGRPPHARHRQGRPARRGRSGRSGGADHRRRRPRAVPADCPHQRCRRSDRRSAGRRPGPRCAAGGGSFDPAAGRRRCSGGQLPRRSGGEPSICPCRPIARCHTISAKAPWPRPARGRNPRGSISRGFRSPLR